jgi:ABC-2 type transport system permease protein
MTESTIPSREPYSFLAGAWFVARKDLAHMLRRRETIVWTFVMPIIFFYFIGTVTAGFGSPAREQKAALAVRGAEDGGVLVDELLRRLGDQNYEIVRPDPETFGTFERRLTIPRPAASSFSDAVLAGQRQTITFERRGESPIGRYDQARVARAVYEVLADLAVVRIEGRSASAESFAALKSMPRALTIHSKPAGHRITPPTGFSQAVPGTMVMFTMLVLLTSGAITLVVERRQGLLRRLASAPISTGSVVLGKWIGRVLLALVQIAFAMLVGTILFRMNWGHTVPMVFLVLVAWAAFTASLAILLASVTRTDAQTAGIGVLATQLLAALGGCWWPIEITPAWMQRLAIALPTGWTMDAMHKLINFGDPAASAVPHVIVLVAAAAFAGWLSAKTFKYQ